MSDIVIIGGGVTGLSAGIHLLLRENNEDTVTICESHGVPGGNLTGWDRNGYHIDNCVHWLTGTLPGTDTYNLWQTLGALDDNGTVRLPSLYTVRDDDSSLTLWRDLDRTWREMLSLSFEDRVEIDRLFHAVRLVSHFTHTSVDGLKLREAVKYSPALALYWSISTGTLAARFRHPLIRRFITGVCDEVFSAISLVAVMATFCSGNGDLPVSGSREMANRMAERFTSLGGHLLCGQHVTEVTLRQAGELRKKRHACSVRTDKGLSLPSDYVIFTGDPATFCGRVIDAPLPRGLAAKYRDVGSIRFSGIHAAFGVPTDVLTFSGDLIRPASEPLLPGCRQVVLREFTHEPGFAPDGMTVLQVTAFCMEKTASDVIALSRNRADYAAHKARIAALFERILVEECPRAAGRCLLLDVWTPATYRRFVGTEIGSFMSFVLRPRELPRRLDGRVPGTDNVLLAGQWLHAPGGLPLAADEGRRAARIVSDQLKAEAELHGGRERRLTFDLSPALPRRHS